MKQQPPTRASWAAALRANAERKASAKPRNPALVIVDIVASIALLVFALGVAILVAGNATAYLSVLEECTPSQVDGLTCNGTVLSIVCVALIVVAVLGFLVALGMVIVKLIQRRWTFWWPLGANVLMIGLFYLGTWIVVQTLPDVITP